MSPSSKRYASPLHVEINPSSVVISVLAVAHIMALVALWLTPMPLLVQASVSVAIVYSALRNIRLHGTRVHPKSICQCVWGEDDKWKLTFANESEQVAIVTDDVFVFSKLLVLNFVLEDSKRRVALVLTPDMIDENTYRQLRVRLKLHRTPTDR